MGAETASEQWKVIEALNGKPCITPHPTPNPSPLTLRLTPRLPLRLRLPPPLTLTRN